MMTESATSSERAPIQTEWSPAGRTGFRFVGVYLLLYCLPLGILWHAVVPAVAIHVFHLSGAVVEYRITGSGDTTLDYVQNLCILVIAVAVALVWSLVVRNSKDYRTVHSWLRVIVRYTLAFTLFGYGFAKVFPLQFPYPQFGRMIEPFGDFSPMGVLWSFMGSSPAYTMFAGAAEVAGGALLLFRRTTMLGAMVSAAVLLNVVVLNFCYDVPVKLYSSNLLLMAVFLMTPDLGKLFDFLVLNRPAGRAAEFGPFFEKHGLRIGALVVKVLLIVFMVGQNVVRNYQSYQSAVVRADRPPLYGLYQVESFAWNGESRPTDSIRWNTVTMQSPAFIRVMTMDGSDRAFASQYDAQANRLTISAPLKIVLTYSQPDAAHVVLTGTMGDDPLEVLMRRREFPLMKRGFHWISEDPFNR